LYPAQTQLLRKEQLYEAAIKNFDQGKIWERAISLIKELKDIYQKQTYSYEKLTALLELQSSLTLKILNEKRFFNEYYRVGYFGKGFNENLAGKEFIYRGQELEMRQDFVSRITHLFPNATILTYTDDPPEETRNGTGQFLQITSVKPSSVAEMNGQKKSNSRRNAFNAFQILCFQ